PIPRDIRRRHQRLALREETGAHALPARDVTHGQEADQQVHRGAAGRFWAARRDSRTGRGGGMKPWTWKLPLIASLAGSIYAYPHVGEPYAMWLAIYCMAVAAIAVMKEW